MLECAITSLKCALRDDYPEFAEFYEEKPWLPKEEAQNAESAFPVGESAEQGEADEVSTENEI
jgi:hypothetical protein